MTNVEGLSCLLNSVEIHVAVRLVFEQSFFIFYFPNALTFVVIEADLLLPSFQVISMVMLL